METEKIVTVCVNVRSNPNMPSCGARGGLEIAQQLETAVIARGLPVKVKRFNCLGMCERGPNVKLSPGGEFCHAVHSEELAQLLDRIAAFARE